MGKSFQKIIAIPSAKYRENIPRPKINRNRFAGDFCCLCSLLKDDIDVYCPANWKNIGIV